MEKDNKAFHQAKAEAWERLSIIEQLARIYKVCRDAGLRVDEVPTKEVLERTINDMLNDVCTELNTSNVFRRSTYSDFPVKTMVYDGEPLFEADSSVAEDEMEHHGHRL